MHWIIISRMFMIAFIEDDNLDRVCLRNILNSFRKYFMFSSTQHFTRFSRTSRQVYRYEWPTYWDKSRNFQVVNAFSTTIYRQWGFTSKIDFYPQFFAENWLCYRIKIILHSKNNDLNIRSKVISHHLIVEEYYYWNIIKVKIMFICEKEFCGFNIKSWLILIIDLSFKSYWRLNILSKLGLVVFAVSFRS